MRILTHLFSALFLFAAARGHSQDTFSIVAADSITREVGSAGASCVNLIPFGLDPDFLGDLLPNTGAINTQAWYLANNQYNARLRMEAGDPPEQILDWLIENDAGNNPLLRQYGIVGFVDSVPVAVGYTGSATDDVKYHKVGRTGPYAYAIQGNILLGQFIIDSMEARFIAAQGDLKCKLMAALQGANVVGADSRCEPYGTSSLFAFVKVAKPEDQDGFPSFNLGVKETPANAWEPIDSLQNLFDETVSCLSSLSGEPGGGPKVSVFPNPASESLTLRAGDREEVRFVVRDVLGIPVKEGRINGVQSIDVRAWNPGAYLIEIYTEKGKTARKWIKSVR